MEKSLIKLWKDVDSIKKDQLLQSSFQGQLTVLANAVTPIKVVVPTGRGDVKSLAFGISANQPPTFLFTLDINGKTLYKDAPSDGFLVLQTGSVRLVKIAQHIPEGSTITITVTTITLGVGGAIGILDLYFTDKFIPLNSDFDYIQYFPHNVPAASANFEDFILPANRGHIVGLSLFTEGLDTVYSASANAQLSINGVQIIENYIPSRYFASQNSLQTNNWIVNIKGGATMRSLVVNSSTSIINLGIFIYFKERKLLEDAR